MAEQGPGTSGQHSHRGSAPGMRGARFGAAPSYSLVVASTASAATLESWLQRTAETCRRRGLDVVVARSTTADELRGLQSRHPRVLFMPAPDGSTRAQLRAIGLTATEGDIVVLTDDEHQPDPDWIAAMTVQAAPST